MIRFLLFFFSLLLLNTIALSENITDISIYGNKRIPNETIYVLGNIETNFNYDINDSKLDDIVKKLYESNFFSDVSVDIINNTLLINVKENPIIETIQIEGIKKDSLREVLLELISLKSRMSFIDFALKKDTDLIKNFLKQNGYYFAEVTPTIQSNIELNSVRINFKIDQGPRATIKKINFIGDKKIKDKKLLEIISSEENKFWKFISGKVYLDKDRIDLDTRLIENYYKNIGYYNVQVLSTFVELSKNGSFYLNFNINAGNVHYFNDFSLVLPSDYDVNEFKEIEDFFLTLKGKKYSLDEFNKILSNIEKVALLKLYDFINAEVDIQILEDNKIDFTFIVKDSPSFFVERINIMGNFNTFEEVIRNKLIVDEGDPLNKILLNKSINDLRSLGIFKKVEQNIKSGSSENLKELDIIVEEIPTGEISLAAGVGTSGSTIGGGITEKNFLGKGINLKTFLELSENSIKGELSYFKPNFAYTDNSLLMSLNSTTTDNLSDYGYKVSEIGFSIGTEFEQYENLFFSPEFRGSLEDLETNSSASKSLKNQQGNYTDLYFGYGFKYDARNTTYNPTSGSISRFFQELPLVSDNKEISNTFIFTHYKELSKNSNIIGKTNLYLKSINTLDSESDVRISKRANVPYSRLRGFEKGKVGPIDNDDYVGGNYVSALNLSSNLPFLFPSFEAIDFSFFVDVANVWGVDYNSDIDDSNFLRSSSGLGMNLLTPIGPLSFSLSQPITKKNTDKTETFRFNLGTTF